MIIRCGLFLLFVSCACSVSSRELNVVSSEFVQRFSWWPSVHNAATLLRHRRESPPPSDVPGPNEGVAGVPIASKPQSSTTLPPAPPQADNKNETKTNATTVLVKLDQTTQVPGNPINTNAQDTAAVLSNVTAHNITLVDKPARQLDFNSPGVLKRGLIVFGGFGLMALAYFIFYRKSKSNNEPGNSHSMIDANQFRYGVLQSEDKRDNELSRIPLTMESDDEEDEDLEIFDLEQKKKSLSYVNLQTTDEDIVLSPREGTAERDNLLLDIDDSNPDTLINWSSNGSKSIL